MDLVHPIGWSDASFDITDSDWVCLATDCLQNQYLLLTGMWNNGREFYVHISFVHCQLKHLIAEKRISG